MLSVGIDLGRGRDASRKMSVVVFENKHPIEAALGSAWWSWLSIWNIIGFVLEQKGMKIEKEYRWRGSNPRSQACEACVLTTRRQRHHVCQTQCILPYTFNIIWNSHSSFLQTTEHLILHKIYIHSSCFLFIYTKHLKTLERLVQHSAMCFKRYTDIRN